MFQLLTCLTLYRKRQKRSIDGALGKGNIFTVLGWERLDWFENIPLMFWKSSCSDVSLITVACCYPADSYLISVWVFKELSFIFGGKESNNSSMTPCPNVWNWIHSMIFWKKKRVSRCGVLRTFTLLHSDKAHHKIFPDSGQRQIWLWRITVATMLSLKMVIGLHI